MRGQQPVVSTEERQLFLLSTVREICGTYRETAFRIKQSSVLMQPSRVSVQTVRKMELLKIVMSSELVFLNEHETDPK